MLTATLQLPSDPMATERFGRWLGERLRPGDTLGLIGELGAGKTTLVRGLAHGLEVDDPEAVSSPTYLLVIEHPGPRRLLHADAYLPAKLAGFLDDGGLEYLFDARKVVVVEWPERVRKWLPERLLWITIEPASHPGRRVGLRAEGPQACPWLTELATIWERR